ncbi:MAG: EAL domain-containing protein [Zoogloeaceae bacterium]|jgi:diguanylate cyclase (GGDEF)-like protein/PAS domain S-box-containing protein|nr:EAL domain-containing protein [Zoogloeaceae bacterium]
MPENVSQEPAPYAGQHSAVFAECPVPFAITNLQGRYVDVNRAFETTFGWPRHEVIGRTSMEIGIWESSAERGQFIERLQRNSTVRFNTANTICRDGSRYRCRLFASLLSYRDETYIFTVVIDIHDLLLAEGEARFYLERFQQLYEHMRDGCSLVGKDGRFVRSNRAFCDMLGYSEEELQHLTPRNITPARWHEQDIRIENEQAFTRGYSDIYEKEHRRKDGSIFPIEIQLYCNFDASGESDGFWGIVRDISERKAQQEHLNFLAYHDPLTRLPNRTLFFDRLEHALKRAKRTILGAMPSAEMPFQQLQLALLFLDIDHFKNVNDTLGHLIGDTLLQILAQNITHCLRESDVLARFGGDEFVILLDSPVTLESATTITRRILALFAKPVYLPQQDKEIYVTASIGVSLFPRDGLNAETLVKHADLAMFKAKDLGRNTFHFYEATLGASLQERVQMEAALRSAAQRNEFILHYQPQIDLATGKLAGVEALLRWRHPERGIIPPLHFIPIIEDIGLIGQVGAWAITEACRQMAAWRAAGLKIPRMAVNFSVQQLEYSGLVDFVARQLWENCLQSWELELEVTESLLMHRTEQTLAILRDLEMLGIQLSIDDFGTGYSSLAYLKTLPVHRLKIDYSFVRDIGHDSNDEAIIRAIIALARSLGLETVAEGVEREEQERFLHAEGCRIGQGFRYARPLSADQILAMFHGKPAV